MAQDVGRLKERATKGVVWATLGSSLTQAAKLVLKVALARLLLPEDFGLVAIGLLVINGLALFTELGIGTAIIQRKDRIKESSDAAFLMVLALGVILFSLAFILSPLLAKFFGKSTVEPIVKILSFTFIISSFGIIPSNLLTKEIQFKKRFLPDTLSVAVYGVVTISLALMNYGVWSLVYGYVASVVSQVVLVWLVSGWKPSGKFERKVARELFGYGKYILGTGVLAFLILQGDNAVVGKLLGVTALGYYSLAYMIANLPATNITHVITGAMFPVFSKLQDERERLRRAYLKTLKVSLILMLPFCGGIFILGPDFVSVVLGEKWMPMLFALRVLCLFGVFRSLQNISGYLLQAIGMPKTQMNLLFLQFIGLAIIIIPLTMLKGILGTSIAVTTVMLVGSFWLTARVIKILRIERIHLLETLRGPMIGSLAMISAIWAAKRWLITGTSIIHFIGLVSLGIISYSIVLIILDRRLIFEVRELMALLKRSEPTMA